MNNVFDKFRTKKTSNLQLSADLLEVEYGTAIFEELTGQSLTRKGQPVRLFDQTSKSSEVFYPNDEKGKPYVQNFQEGRRSYPISAYMQAHDLDWKTAVQQLITRYLGDGYKPSQTTTKGLSNPFIVAAVKRPPSFHDPELVASTLTGYEHNNFAIYLRRLLSMPVADELVSLFRVGTGTPSVAPEWHRCTVYWQIDELGRIHAGKVMYYNLTNGKRMKEKNSDFAKPSWVHDIKGLPNFELDQCLFGLHQLADAPAKKPVAIVESEKTAIIATAFMPGFLWLACGGLSQLSAAKCKPLSGRPIKLFPDLGGFDHWQQKADELQRLGYTVSVSKILEKWASSQDRREKLDLADFLARHRCPTSGRVLNEADGYPALWDCEPLNPNPTIIPITSADFGGC